MFENIFKIAVRNLWRNKFYSLINIIGLTVGLTAVILIALYIKDESSYDKMYSDFERVYRLESEFDIKGNIDYFAMIPHPLPLAMEKEIPEIESFTRVRKGQGLLYFVEDRKFYEEGVYLVDSTYLDIFDIELVSGDPVTALTKPGTIVVSKSMAQRYFGDEDPVGKSISNEGGGSLEVTGVYQDLPYNMHLRPDALASYHTLAAFWGGEDNFNDLSQAIQFWRVSTYGYIKIQEGATIQDIHEKFESVYDKYMASLEEVVGGTFSLLSTRVDKIYHSEYNYQGDVVKGNYQYVMIMFLVGIMIIVLAAINYMNLATARSSNRSKEVAIRKVVGSSNSRLVFQFIFEAVFLSVFSFLLALSSVEFLMDIRELLKINSLFFS